MKTTTHRRVSARLLLTLGLALAAGCDDGGGAECGPGTSLQGGICVPTGAAPDGGSVDGAQCPDGTLTVDLNDDGIPEQCLPAPVAGDCDDPPALRGPIDRDTLLAEGACFTVAGELAVTCGALLAMSPGVTLTFGPDAALTVDGGYLASLGTAANPVTLTGGDGPGHWQGVRFAAASEIALEPPPSEQAFEVALPDGSTFAPEVHAQPQPVASFYDYRSASAHTGFEAVDRSLVALHRDTNTGALSPVLVHGKDTTEPNAQGDQPYANVRMTLTGVPAGARVAVEDEPTENIVPEGDTLTARWGFLGNTDGLALTGLPTDADWAITIDSEDTQGRPEGEDGGDGDRITEWVYVAPDGSTTALPLGESITLSAQVVAPAEAPAPALEGREAFNVLRGITVEHAQAGVALEANDVAVIVDGATLRANQLGLRATAPAAGLRLRDSVLADNAQAAARITPYQLDAFQGGNRFEGESANVRVSGGALVVDRPVPAAVPTVFDETLIVTGGATLTAEPGADLVFGEKTALVLDRGRFVARGGPDRTRLRGADQRAGSWGGIRITNNGGLELAGVEQRRRRRPQRAGAGDLQRRRRRRLAPRPPRRRERAGRGRGPEAVRRRLRRRPPAGRPGLRGRHRGLRRRRSLRWRGPRRSPVRARARGPHGHLR